MTVNIAGRSVSVAALLAGLGGLVAIVAVVLPWATFEGNSVNGLDEDLNGGKVVLIVGILIVAVAAAAILKVKIPQSGLILAVLGAVVLAVLVIMYLTNLLSDPSLKDAIDEGAAFGIGFILEAIAGIVAIAGGGWGVLRKAA